MSTHLSSEQFYAGLQHLPKPVYPFPDFMNPYFREQREEYYEWIDREYTFHSKDAREKHKTHHLTDIAARGLPFLKSLAELRPIANYAANGAMMDDYWDRCSHAEMNEIQKRITALLTGEDSKEPADHGIFHQFWVLRQDALKCEMPERLYNKFVAAMHNVLVGYMDERTYYRANTPPPFEIYTIIRENTSGAIPFCKYVAMQKEYRQMPDDVLEHPHILRLHALCAGMIGIHNDIISLPKELHREEDIMNLVKIMKQEHKVSLEEAYMMTLDVHNNYLKEFILLQEHLPVFGQWQDMACNYVKDLGIMVAGVYAWHTNDTTRYVPGGYVDGEYVSKF